VRQRGASDPTSRKEKAVRPREKPDTIRASKSDPIEFPFDSPTGLLSFASTDRRVVLRFRRSSCDPSHLLTDNTKLFFTTADSAPNNWIQFEFLPTRSVSRVTLTSHPKYPLKSWKLVAGLSDGSTRVVHESDAEEGMKSGDPFTVDFSSIEPRTLTIEQTGPTWLGRNMFGLCEVVFSGPPDLAPIDPNTIMVVSNDLACMPDPQNSACLRTFSYTNSRSWLQIRMHNGLFSVVGYRVRSHHPEHRYTLYGCTTEDSTWEAVPASQETFQDPFLKVVVPATKPFLFIKLELTDLGKCVSLRHFELFGSWSTAPGPPP
jgi:hypothetical protein